MTAPGQWRRAPADRRSPPPPREAWADTASCADAASAIHITEIKREWITVARRYPNRRTWDWLVTPAARTAIQADDGNYQTAQKRDPVFGGMMLQARKA